MKRHCLVLTLGVAAILLATQHAFSQENRSCGPRDRVVQRLETTYGETRQSIGLAPNSGVIEIFASDQTGTWTITVTTPNGTTCLVASGQAFESFPQASVTPGQDT